MNKTIGALIKAYRKDIGLTQIDMAKIMKTSQSQVSKYESNDLTPSLLEFRRLFRHAIKKGTHENLSALLSWLDGEKAL